MNKKKNKMDIYRKYIGNFVLTPVHSANDVIETFQNLNSVQILR